MRQKRDDSVAIFRDTVHWYIDNHTWMEAGAGAGYENWLATNYGDRERA